MAEGSFYEQRKFQYTKLPEQDASSKNQSNLLLLFKELDKYKSRNSTPF